MHRIYFSFRCNSFLRSLDYLFVVVIVGFFVLFLVLFLTYTSKTSHTINEEIVKIVKDPRQKKITVISIEITLFPIVIAFYSRRKFV